MRATRRTMTALLLLAGVPVHAEVVDAGANGFTVRSSIEVPAPPSAAYDALVDGVSRWWDAAHSYTGDAANLSIDARPGGCFCERFPAGGGVAHMTVAYAAPGSMLRMTGGLGPLQALGVAGSMSWEFVDRNGVTAVTLTYTVGGYAGGGLDRWAEPVDGMLRGQLTRLGNYLAGDKKD